MTDSASKPPQVAEAGLFFNDPVPEGPPMSKKSQALANGLSRRNNKKFAPRKEADLIDLNSEEATPRRRRQIIPEMVMAGAETLLFGEKGRGKSTIVEYLCACVITGYARPGEPSTARHPPMTVIYLSAEDDFEASTSPRVQTMAAMMCAQMGIDFDAKVRSRFAFLRSLQVIDPTNPDEVGTIGFNMSADIEVLRKAVAQLNKKNPDAPVGLIVVSPITAYSGVMNSNDGSQVRAALLPMASFIKEADLAALYIGHPRKASATGEDAASVTDTHSGSAQIANAVRVVFFVMKDPEIMEDGQPSPYSLLLRDKCNLPDWHLPWGMRYATFGDEFKGRVLDEDGRPEDEGTVKIVGIKWIERCDRNPDEVIRDMRMAEREATNEKWTDAARLILETMVAALPQSFKDDHPVKGDQMRRVKADAGISDSTWKRGKEWLRHAQLVEAGLGPQPDWKLGSGRSPIDGDSERLRKVAGQPSMADGALADADGPPAHFAAIPPAEEP